MPRGTARNIEKKVYTLPESEWQWRVVDRAAFGSKDFCTEDGFTSTGGYEKIQLIVKVGNAQQHIHVFVNLIFTDAAAWKVTEFMKSAGIFPGDGVEYYLTAHMCIGLGGTCRTRNEVPDGSKFERTQIVEFLETAEQHPEKIPGFLMTQDAGEAAMQIQGRVENTEYEQDDIPF
jgi:hypothetical protein